MAVLTVLDDIYGQTVCYVKQKKTKLGNKPNKKPLSCKIHNIFVTFDS